MPSAAFQWFKTPHAGFDFFSSFFAMDTLQQVLKFLPTSWCSMDVPAGQNPWPLLKTVELDRLGPQACFRLKVLWMTGHLEPFYITEGPMVAKLWRLEKMTSDGMLLERASKHADPSMLVVRPNEAAILISVEIQQEYYTHPIEISCYFLSGYLAWDGRLPADATWLDLAYKLYTVNNNWWNVSFVKGMDKVARSFYNQPISLPVPQSELELKEMEVKELAVSGFFGSVLVHKNYLKIEKEKQKAEKAKMAKEKEQAEKDKKVVKRSLKRINKK